METIHFETLGCKLNQIEIEAIASAFAQNGYTVDFSRISANDPGKKILQSQEPLFSIINTCTVTGKADQKSRRQIRLLLKKFPSSPVLVTGCYAEVEEQTIAKMHSRIIVLPGSQKDYLITLPYFLQSWRKSNPNKPTIQALFDFIHHIHTIEKTNAIQNSNSSLKEKKPQFALNTDSFKAHSRASIKIQDGCNNLCSYCRIRLARGKAISLPIEKIIESIQDIYKAGWNEVILTGVNLSQYKDGSYDFADVLKQILEKTNNIAIRISSLYPERIDKKIAPFLAHERIRPHFHISVQSGSNTILKSMRRPYTIQTIYDAVSILRSVKNNPFIACDIIVGYPGETEKDFEKTYELCEQLNFADIHVFPFSPRPGTEAWDLKPKIPERITKQRVKRLVNLANANKKNYELSWIDKPLLAIVEQIHANQIKVLTENYISCEILTDTLNDNECFNIKKGDEISIILDSSGYTQRIKKVLR